MMERGPRAHARASSIEHGHWLATRDDDDNGFGATTARCAPGVTKVSYRG